MLATLARELPTGACTYEPKWDGFRCLAFVDGDAVDLRSRNDKPLSRYFPEVVASLPDGHYVVDGELVVAAGFDALLKRIHPAASKVASARVETPARLVVFDVLAVEDRVVMPLPFLERRALLESLLPDHVTAATRDVGVADGWLDARRSGIDGVVAKADDLVYEPGKRRMIKVKRLRTADCVVAGCRLAADGSGVSSLLLGLYDGEVLRHVGVAGSFMKARRAAFVDELRPHAVPLAAHPWREGFALEGGSMGRLPGSAGRWSPDMTLDWVPLAPVLVCEASYDQVDGYRWRHPGRFVRWRPDRTPGSCTVDQLCG